jgi:putative polymerase
MASYSDMGYAYALSRFGAPLSIGLICVIFLIPMTNSYGSRFRVLIILYIFSNLAISGTSVFALKTAGLAWFLMGVLVDRRPASSPAATIPGRTHLTNAGVHVQPCPLAALAPATECSSHTNEKLA